MRTPAPPRTRGGRRSRPPAGGLRARWTRALAVFVVVLTGGGLASFIGTRSTVASFRDAAVRMEREADALARLRADIVSVAVLRAAAVQNPGSDLAPLEAGAAAEAASFARAIEILRPGGGREVIEHQFALSRQSMPSDITTLSPPEFVARVAKAQENFALIDEAARVSRARAGADLAKAATLERNLTAATVLIGLVVGALVIRFARRFSTEILRPVAELRDSADRLAAGELDHRVDIDRADEIGDLAATFNSMADVVAGSHRALTLQANHDALTGLANRAAFYARLEAVLARRDRRDGTQAVLFVDLDDFKDVNDRLGHAAGDALLRAVAARLSDAVRPGDLVARLGGDEFAILLDGVPEPAVALEVAERAVASLASPVEISGTPVQLGASAGLAMRHDGSDPDSLMREADMAMYSAKARGKNRVERHEAGSRESAQASGAVGSMVGRPRDGSPRTR